MVNKTENNNIEKKIHQTKRTIESLSAEQSSLWTGSITLIMTVTAILISVDAFIGSALININIYLTLFCLGYIIYSTRKLYTWFWLFIEYRSYRWEVLVLINKSEQIEDEEIQKSQDKVNYFNEKAYELGKSFRTLINAHSILFIATFLALLAWTFIENV